MTAVVASDCAGLWRRTLLVDADGSRDTATGVQWLQGVTAYVDSRGFAGRLRQQGTVFTWQRDIALEPPGAFPDAGEMRWDGDILIEAGVHEQYLEHWVRDESPRRPSGALFVTAPDADTGLLVRVGALFGWAGAGEVAIGAVGDARWAALGIRLGDKQIHAKGVRWTITSREGSVGS